MATSTIPSQHGTLLWSNSSPSSSFASQELSGTGGYGLYAIKYKPSTSASSYYTLFYAIRSGETQTNSVLNVPASGACEGVFRSVTKNAGSGTLTIGNCEYKAVTSTGSRTQDNSRMIPIEVWGMS